MTPKQKQAEHALEAANEALRVANLEVKACRAALARAKIHVKIANGKCIWSSCDKCAENGWQHCQKHHDYMSEYMKLRRKAAK